MWYSRVRESCVNPVLTEVDGNASGTRSTEQSSCGWANDQQISHLIWNLKVHNLLISIPPVIYSLRNIKLEHTLKPFLLRSYLILSFNVWWGLSAFLPNCIICNIYTFQRDTQCCSTECLLMLRCQLYMFRTVTVHAQELLFRCCMCRLWTASVV